jgi:hypothetical protein
MRSYNVLTPQVGASRRYTRRQVSNQGQCLIFTQVEALKNSGRHLKVLRLEMTRARLALFKLGYRSMRSSFSLADLIELGRKSTKYIRPASFITS